MILLIYLELQILDVSLADLLSVQRLELYYNWWTQFTNTVRAVKFLG